jgi:acyl dehydratase
MLTLGGPKTMIYQYWGEIMATRYLQLFDLQALVGQPLGSSEWLTVDQARIDAFAAATGDHQWIHTASEQAASGPFGGPIAHGFLTLSLLPVLMQAAYRIENARMSINYGLNRVRFPAVLPAGSRVRGHASLTAYEPLDGGAQITVSVSVERDGQSKPACVAESLSRHFV